MLKKLKKTNRKGIITFIFIFFIITMEGSSYFWATPHSNSEPTSTISQEGIKRRKK